MPFAEAHARASSSRFAPESLPMRSLKSMTPPLRLLAVDLNDHLDFHGDGIGQRRHADGDRACRPRSPKTSTSRSEQPLITAGGDVNSGSALTMPSTLTTRVTLSRSPMTLLRFPSRFRAHPRAAW